MTAARRRTIIGAEPAVDDFRCACASARRVARTLTQFYDRSLRSAGMEVVENVNRQPFVDAVRTLDPEFEKLFGKELLTAVKSTP